MAQFAYWRVGLAAVGVVLALASAQEGAAAAACMDPSSRDSRLYWDPCPAADSAANELPLPLPGGSSMVFRRVKVPGSEFWCNNRRLVPLGDSSDSDPFAPPQRVPVAGSFPAEGGGDHWYYYLAKYEMTLGQAAEILGGGDVNRGLSHVLGLLRPEAARASVGGLITAIESDLRVNRTAALAKPLRGLTQKEYEDVLERYNRWCYADRACLAQLSRKASLDGVPGFIRLPTEIEWEYAARGGGTVASGDSAFENPRPFDRATFRKYVVSKSDETLEGNVQRIGGNRLPTPGGFYDVLGNVQELTSSIFLSELSQGKAGGVAARGGSWLADQSQLGYALRAEFAPYTWRPGSPPVLDGPTRDPFTGIRPLIGSVSKPTSSFLRTVSDPKLKESARSCRDFTPIGLSLRGDRAVARDILESSAKTAGEIGYASRARRDAPAAMTEAKLLDEVKKLEDSLRAAKLRIAAENQRVCSVMMRAGMGSADTQFRFIFEAKSFERLAAIYAEQVKRGGARPSPEQEERIRKAQSDYEGTMKDFENEFNLYRDVVLELGRMSDREDDCVNRAFADTKRHLEHYGITDEYKHQGMQAVQRHALSVVRRGYRVEAWRSEILEIGKKIFQQRE